MPAHLVPDTWDTDRAADVVIDTLARVAPEAPRALLVQKADSMVAAFVDALDRQGLSVQEVASGEWVHLEWLAAEISVQGDWRGLPSDPYDYADARVLAQQLLSHVREGAQQDAAAA